MPKRIDLGAVKVFKGSRYPVPFDQPCAARLRQRLGDAASLSAFGVNLLRLPPGVWSSQRHWHSAEDEFIYVLEGEVILVTDGGEELLRPGDCAGFSAGIADGHHLQNRSARDALVLEVGSRQPDSDEVDYSDIDMRVDRRGFTRKNGEPYPPKDSP